MHSITGVDFAEVELRVLGSMGDRYIDLFARVFEINPYTLTDEVRLTLREVTRSYIHGMPQEYTDKLVKKAHKLLDKHIRNTKCLN